MLNRASFYWHFHLFGTVCSLIAKITVVTRRCFDRTNDSITTFKSVFLLIPATAVSKALWRKFAQSGKGASWMIFPSVPLTDSSPAAFGLIMSALGAHTANAQAVPTQAAKSTSHE
jgi:hypothetical protein